LLKLRVDVSRFVRSLLAYYQAGTTQLHF